MGFVLGTTGALVMAGSALYYLVDVLRGGTRPQRTSWLVWALVGVLGYASADAGGAGPGAWAAGVDAAACAVTFGVSLHPRFGKPGGRRADLLLGIVAVGGVLLWRWGPLDTGAAAALAVGCDAVALWPTLREAWRQPGLESLPSWSADVLGNGLCLLAVSQLSVAALLFPAYLVAAAGTVAAVLVLGRRRAPVQTAVAAVAYAHQV